MTLHRSAIAVAILLAATASHADSFLGSLDLSPGGAVFGRNNATGVFEDVYTFVLPLPGYLVSASTGTSSPDPAHDLDLNNPRIVDGGGLTFATFLGNRGDDANESYWLPSTFLPAGSYQLVISGVDSVGQASYSGNLSISAVPEPKSYAMFLAGLAALGFVAGRRRRDSSSG